MKNNIIHISDYDYRLPEERIAKFPPEKREQSSLLVYRGRKISHTCFPEITNILPKDSLIVFNNTKVIRARLVLRKESGARIEIFCLEPSRPADYERAFSVKNSCEWSCIIGNSKKWKEGALSVGFSRGGSDITLKAYKCPDGSTVRFEWDGRITFGELLEELGRIPIPPYLNRESEEIDLSRYQTIYSKHEGSVAAPTAGLHFTTDIMNRLTAGGITFTEVTLHVGAGTFMPVKCENAADHPMHTEYFEVTAAALRQLIHHYGSIAAVGTTTLRTIESLTALGFRTKVSGAPREDIPVSQWELYDIPGDTGGRELLEILLRYMEENRIPRLKTASGVMIVPGYKFRVADMLITNFHQPKSTLLLLVSAFTAGNWREIYDYALDNGMRFLSYGDSSILFR